MSVIVHIQKKLAGFSLNVDFEAASSGITGLLGASGSGKSMTLGCIAGIVRPDTGYIEVDGRVFFDSDKKINLPARERNTGFLFQNYALFPNMTVAQNITAGLKHPNMDKYKSLLLSFELTGLENRKPYELSGGQQQRTALARIFIRDPSVLLLDEPFSALDTSLRWSLQRETKELLEAYSGSTLFVSHSRDEIYMLCQEAGVVENGRMVSFGSVKSLFEAPQTKAGMRLTGIKNIADFTRTDERHVCCPAWDVSFNAPGHMAAGTAGIRANYFYPCGPDDPNAMEIDIVRVISFPFSQDVLFRRKGSKPAELMCWNRPWSELRSGVQPHYPKYLAVAPDRIILIKENEQA